MRSHTNTEKALILLASCILITSCSRPAAVEAAPSPPPPTASPGSSDAARIVRATGTIQAVRTYTVRVPQLAQISGRNPQLTLTTLAPNGTAVKKDDTLVEFDATAQIDDLRDAKAKLDDFEHQLEEKRAEVNNDSVQRLAKIRESESDLSKAELQLRKGPVLADLERKKNEVRAAAAVRRVASLRKSHDFRTKSETAAVRVLELKSERQRLVVGRLQTNIEKLSVKAPHDGMVALENTWRSGSMGPPQVGDQMYPNQPVLRVFDPSEMIVDTQVNEPDSAVLAGLARARVHLDAYPDAVFEAHLESASPVATAGLESPVKSFAARFRIAAHDQRLLPDLSASLEIEIPKPPPPETTLAAGGAR